MSFLLTTYDFRSPSGMHIFHLANALTEQHVNCVTYSIDNADTVPRYGQPTFRSYDQETSPYNLAAEVNFFTGRDHRSLLDAARKLAHSGRGYCSRFKRSLSWLRSIALGPVLREIF